MLTYADKSLSQPWCSHSNMIYVQLQKTIVLRMQSPSNLDAATTMRSAQTELQNTIEIRARTSAKDSWTISSTTICRDSVAKHNRNTQERWQRKYTSSTAICRDWVAKDSRTTRKNVNKTMPELAVPQHGRSEHDPGTAGTVRDPSAGQASTHITRDAFCLAKYTISCIRYLAKTHFVRDFLQIPTQSLQTKLWMRDFLPIPSVQALKTNLSCETSFKFQVFKLCKRTFRARLPSNSKCSSFENEPFVRDFLQIPRVQALQTNLSRETSFKFQLLKLCNRSSRCEISFEYLKLCKRSSGCKTSFKFQVFKLWKRRHSNFQTSRLSDIQTLRVESLRHSGFQTVKLSHSDFQTFKLSDIQTFRHPDF